MTQFWFCLACYKRGGEKWAGQHALSTTHRLYHFVNVFGEFWIDGERLVDEGVFTGVISEVVIKDKALDKEAIRKLSALSSVQGGLK